MVSLSVPLFCSGGLVPCSAESVSSVAEFISGVSVLAVCDAASMSLGSASVFSVSGFMS